MSRDAGVVWNRFENSGPSTTFYRQIRGAAKLIHEDAIDFGLVDQKGRAIGYSVSACSVKFEEMPAGTSCGYTSTWAFEASAFVTRDGQQYGATPRTITAETIDELKKKIAKRIAGARARMSKKFGTESFATPRPTEQIRDDAPGDAAPLSQREIDDLALAAVRLVNLAHRDAYLENAVRDATVRVERREARRLLHLELIENAILHGAGTVREIQTLLENGPDRRALTPRRILELTKELALLGLIVSTRVPVEGTDGATARQFAPGTEDLVARSLELDARRKG